MRQLMVDGTEPDEAEVRAAWAADLTSMGEKLLRVRERELSVLAELRATVAGAISAGLGETETARLSGLHRITIRRWIGKGWKPGGQDGTEV